MKRYSSCKNRAFCCGAGGGCFWKEEREGSRINHMRFDQLNEAKPETLAVGCPFCMISEGANLRLINKLLSKFIILRICDFLSEASPLLSHPELSASAGDSASLRSG